MGISVSEFGRRYYSLILLTLALCVAVARHHFGSAIVVAIIGASPLWDVFAHREHGEIPLSQLAPVIALSATAIAVVWLV